MHDSFNDFVIVFRERHMHAELFAYLLRFTNNHTQHSTVNRVVHPVKHQSSNHTARLPETVNTPFALFMTGGVPTEIVMNYTVKMLLQVHTLRETIGSYQHRCDVAVEVVQSLDPFFALIRCQLACDYLHMRFCCGRFRYMCPRCGCSR